MATAYETVTVSGEGVRLDRILARRDRRLAPGLVEAALELNPSLAALGPIIPVGTVVRLPPPAAEAAAEIPVVPLWG